MPLYVDLEATDAFGEEATSLGTSYFGLIARVDAGLPAVVVRFNESATDEILLTPGMVRSLGRGANRPITSFQVRSVDSETDSAVNLEFTVEQQPDQLVTMAGPTGAAGADGADGADGAAGAQGPQGPAGPTLYGLAHMGADQVGPIVGQHVEFSAIAGESNLAVSSGAGQANGTITVPQGFVGKLKGRLDVAFNDENGNVAYQWWDVTATALTGRPARLLPATSVSDAGAQPTAIAVIDTSAGARNYQLQITAATGVAQINAAHSHAEIG